MHLKKVMKLKEIQENMNTNLIGNKELFSKIVEAHLLDVKDNKIELDLNSLGLNNRLELILYRGVESNQFLLESRLFDNKDDSMINGYLEIINNDLTIYDEYVDDVWSYDDWVLI